MRHFAILVILICLISSALAATDISISGHATGTGSHEMAIQVEEGLNFTVNQTNSTDFWVIDIHGEAD